MMNNKKGFTLIELMIVVAIIGILAAIAIPKFSDLINKAKEGATKGALSSVRSALQVYYGDNEGMFPTDTLAILTTNGKYINEIPLAKLPGTTHADTKVVTAQAGTAYAGDSGGWAYFNVQSNSAVWGTFVAGCTHDDIKGQNNSAIVEPWTSF